MLHNDKNLQTTMEEKGEILFSDLSGDNYQAPQVEKKKHWAR